MKRYIIALAALIGSIGSGFAEEGAATHKPHVEIPGTSISFPHKLVFTESAYRFSTRFAVDSDEGSQGYVSKPKVALRDCYDYHAPNGEFVCRGLSRLLSLGIKYTWAKSIDVSDRDGNYVGCISGCTMTVGKARFNFYDREGAHVGSAYLDNECMGFTLYDADELGIVARFDRIFVQDVTDYWKVYLEQQHAVDPRLIVMFSAFAIDMQEFFREDV